MVLFAGLATPQSMTASLYAHPFPLAAVALAKCGIRTAQPKRGTFLILYSLPRNPHPSVRIALCVMIKHRRQYDEGLASLCSLPLRAASSFPCGEASHIIKFWLTELFLRQKAHTKKS